MLKKTKPPYSGTEVTPERSKYEIEGLLRKYGIDGVSWTEIWSENRAQLQFLLQDERKRPILVRLQPPPFATKRKTWDAATGRYEQVDAPNWAQSYRLLKAYLKAKLESVAYGLRDIEEEFLSDIVVHDEEGHETTVKEMIDRQVEAGKLRLSLPPPSEAPPSAAKRASVDADYRSV